MLEIRNLKISVGTLPIVEIAKLDIGAGRRLGIVGESGSGKSLTATSIIGLQPRGLSVTGSIRFEGEDLAGVGDIALARVRGRRIGFVPQDPTRSLNPTTRIGGQVKEAVRLATGLGAAAAWARAEMLLGQVRLPDVSALMRRYPHQISGGQQQRVLIAMAMAGNPALLIADEPTTALDVTVQNEILRLIVELSEEKNMALLFVSHELGVVKAVCHQIGVVYGGNLVELGDTADIVARPRHRYTQALLSANPGLSDRAGLERLMGTRFQTIRGNVPPVGQFPSGCRFRDRCGHTAPACAELPGVSHAGPGHEYACWNPVPHGQGAEETA
ncbi:ABC transporter ATP-binding protein [Devosia sp.]|uniref:ABC transporter ATP-binding protein n=1 Tax=Devosia sp. TaxID=1871048 RepID=UPI002AFE51B8|nr:ABC transporter ATP-binding protein [Devosia sp.]